MFRKLSYPPVDYGKYAALMPPQMSEELLAAAEQIKGLRIVHINSTATGGGVAEILQSMVPLMNSLEITTERVVIDPPPEFFQVTKRIHNLLQGAEGDLSTAEKDIYYQSIEKVAEAMRQKQLGADIWFVHDPQVLPLARLLPKRDDETWTWICHIEL